MTARRFPALDAEAIGDTRDALHAYSRLLGAWLKSTRARRKHWWHASLRPSLRGLTTGVVYSSVDFELELDLIASRLRVGTADEEFAEDLAGQSAADIASFLDDSLRAIGVDPALAPGDEIRSDQRFPGYSAVQAAAVQRALASVSAALEVFRAGIREEASPIQIWPHHFDLSMIWLPGHGVPGEDPADEESADMQMNFGFALGDETFAEPYFYITAYPLPAALPGLELPPGTMWQHDGFSGAVLAYAHLAALPEPEKYLLALWATLLAAGREHLVAAE